jgi:hypothetical protein
MKEINKDVLQKPDYRGMHIMGNLFIWATDYFERKESNF